MIVKDWALSAAEEIDAYPGDLSVADIRAIIAKHCPFKLDTAYMPLPANLGQIIGVTYAIGGTADELNTRRGQ